MNKLLTVLILILSSLTVSANPGNSVLTAEAKAMEVEFAKIQQIYAEDADGSRQMVGGLIAFKKICEMEWSDLGRRSIGMVMEDNGSENFFVASGFTSVSEKIVKFGCSLAKSFIKRDDTGVLFFNF